MTVGTVMQDKTEKEEAKKLEALPTKLDGQGGYAVNLSPPSPQPPPPPCQYSLPVDSEEFDRATDIRIFSCARPHMRAFHFSWISLFVSFFTWFSIPPLFPTVIESLSLTADDVALSNIASVASTIFARICVGPVADRFGARKVQVGILLLGAIPVIAVVAVQDANGFILARFFIGFVGAAFVCSQHWPSLMFARGKVGTANAVVAGWGNLGGGLCFLILPWLFDAIHGVPGVTADTAWRWTVAIPGVSMIAVAFLCLFWADDLPTGPYQRLPSTHNNAATTTANPLSRHDIQPPRRTTGTLANRIFTCLTTYYHQNPLLHVLSNRNVLLLALAYACNFGIELQVNNILSLYFYETFRREDCPAADGGSVDDDCRLLTQSTAGLMASLLGLLNVGCRALGGYVSDRVYRARVAAAAKAPPTQRSRVSPRTCRVWVMCLCMAGEAACLAAFSQQQVSLVAAGIALLGFAVSVQAAEGATFALVPVLRPPGETGRVAGVVGAFGNVGAVVWGVVFQQVGNPADAMLILATCVGIVTALIGACMRLPSEPVTRQN